MSLHSYPVLIYKRINNECIIRGQDSKLIKDIYS